MSNNVYALSPSDAPKRSDIEAAVGLIISLADAKGTMATLKRLDAAVAAGARAEDRLAEADRKEAELDARLAGEKEQIAKLWVVHESRVEASQRAHDEAIAADKQALANGKAAVEQERARLVRLNDDLERRLALVKQASV